MNIHRYLLFQQWVPTPYETYDPNPGPNPENKGLSKFNSENRYTVTNQRGNPSNCTPKCFAEKGSRVNLYIL